MIQRKRIRSNTTRPGAWFLAGSLLFGLTGLARSLASGADQEKPGGGIEVPKGYVCERAIGPIEIDGRLDEESWRIAPWTDPFVDIEGDARPRPRFQSRAKMLWDDRYFYIAAEMEEPHVWGTLLKHDSVIFHDNDFEVFIDPDGDNHQYYEIEINALNTEWDLILDRPYRDGGPARNEWEIPGLKTAIGIDGTLNDPTVTDRAWYVEMAIPWSVLAEHAHRRTPPADGDQWRVNFSRVEWQNEVVDGKYRKKPGTKEDNWVWSPQGAIDMHRPERWGYVQFAAGPAGQTKFRPDPTVSARDLLHRIYHAQRAFHAKHKRWAETPRELDLQDSRANKPGQKAPAIRLTPEGFQATVDVSLPDGTTQALHIRQDSCLWQGDGPPPR